MKHNIFSLKGKVVLVTGGSRGIGKVVAKYLADAGADIAIAYQRLDASAVANEIASEYGVRAMAVQVDVTQKDEVKKMIGTVAKEMGTLDILFNNAGICIHKPSLELGDKEWESVIDVNLSGSFYVACEFARYLMEQTKGGSIVNMASMSATIVNVPQRQAAYNSSKAGVVHLTKSLAVEWADKGIRVNCISPGYTNTEMSNTVRQDWQDIWTEMTPMKRLCKPEELAGAVIYLASEASAFTTGADILIDGGFTLI